MVLMVALIDDDSFCKFGLARDRPDLVGGPVHNSLTARVGFDRGRMSRRLDTRSARLSGDLMYSAVSPLHLTPRLSLADESVALPPGPRTFRIAGNAFIRLR